MKYPLSGFDYIIVSHKVGIESEPVLESVHISEEQAYRELMLYKRQSVDPKFGIELEFVIYKRLGS